MSITSSYAKERASENIARALQQRGWNTYDFKPAQLNQIGEDFTSMRWSGVATHPDYPGVMVCVKVRKDMEGRSGQSYRTFRLEDTDQPCTVCAGTGKHSYDRCAVCMGRGKEQREVTLVSFTWPLNILANDERVFWHLQYDDRIIDRGAQYNVFAERSNGAQSRQVLNFCEQLERKGRMAIQAEGQIHRQPVAPVTPPAEAHVSIETRRITAAYSVLPEKNSVWTWLTIEPRLEYELWLLFKERFGAQYHRAKKVSFIPYRVDQEDIDAWALANLPRAAEPVTAPLPAMPVPPVLSAAHSVRAAASARLTTQMEAQAPALTPESDQRSRHFRVTSMIRVPVVEPEPVDLEVELMNAFNTL